MSEMFRIAHNNVAGECSEPAGSILRSPLDPRIFEELSLVRFGALGARIARRQLSIHAGQVSARKCLGGRFVFIS